MKYKPSETQMASLDGDQEVFIVVDENGSFLFDKERHHALMFADRVKAEQSLADAKLNKYVPETAKLVEVVKIVTE